MKFLSEKVEKFDLDNPKFNSIASKYREQMATITAETERLFNLPATDAVLKGRNEGLKRLEKLYSKLPSKPSIIPIDSPTSSGSVTPTNVINLQYKLIL
jgi:hypothetical protein